MPSAQLLPHTERIRDAIIGLDGVSDVRFLDKPELQISIEISPSNLKKFNLSLEQVGQIINANTAEISAGNIRTSQGDILVRTNGRIYTAEEFKQLPIITTAVGNTVLLGDIATITDGFESLDLDTRFNGEPSMSLSVYRSGTESAVAVAKQVRQFIINEKANLPEGVHLNYWRDSSVIVESRLKTLTNSAIQGGILVMVLLALFLRGIPVCFMGAISLMPLLNLSFNMVSLFGFILVLGIVVDDAIVTGESIFKQLRQGKDSLNAAIDGTHEVAIPVTFGILTTVAVVKVYQPILRACLNNKLIAVVTTVCITLLIATYAETGRIRFVFFPEVDDEAVIAQLTMPAKAGFTVTNKEIQYLVDSAKTIQEKYRDPISGDSVIEYIVSFSGVSLTGNIASNQGLVAFEVKAPEDRGNIKISALADEWRDLIGEIPGAQKLSIQSTIANVGRPLSIDLKGGNLDDLSNINTKIREKLRNYDGIFDIRDTISSGKDEVRSNLKPSALALGLTEAGVALQTRHAIYGYEAQKLQRDREEVSVLLRYPDEFRSSIEDLKQLPIQLPNGNTVNLQAVTNLLSSSSPSDLYRNDRQRVSTLSSDADKDVVDLSAIKRELGEYLDELLISYPDISYEFSGEAKEQDDALNSLIFGGFFVLIAIYALLAIPFKSYWQPFVVMSVIPLGFVGAAIGHIIMGANLSLLSFMGLLALTGVVVNDSLVLVDYINKQRNKGYDLIEAVINAGAARFRPVMLTSLFTANGDFIRFWYLIRYLGYLGHCAFELCDI